MSWFDRETKYLVNLNKVEKWKEQSRVNSRQREREKNWLKIETGCDGDDSAYEWNAKGAITKTSIIFYGYLKLSLTNPLSLSLFHSLSHTLNLSLSFTHTLPTFSTFILQVSLSLSLSLSFIPTRKSAFFLIQTITYLHAILSLSHTPIHTLFLSHSLFLSLSIFLLLGFEITAVSANLDLMPLGVSLKPNFEQKITNGGKMVNDGTDCFR